MMYLACLAHSKSSINNSLITNKMELEGCINLNKILNQMLGVPVFIPYSSLFPIVLDIMFPKSKCTILIAVKKGRDILGHQSACSFMPKLLEVPAACIANVAGL